MNLEYYRYPPFLSCCRCTLIFLVALLETYVKPHGIRNCDIGLGFGSIVADIGLEGTMSPRNPDLEIVRSDCD